MEAWQSPADCTAFEMQHTARYREFKSHRFRHIDWASGETGYTRKTQNLVDLFRVGSSPTWPTMLY